MSDHERIRTLVKQWILANASKAAEGGGNQGSVSEQPPGVPFPLTLHGRVGSASRLLVARCTPDELETQRLQRVQTALDRKIPKLVAHKADGRETVLVLESCDTGLGNFSDIGVAVSKALAACSNQPDSIILVETETTPWYVWPLKDGATVHTSQDCIETKSTRTNWSSDPAGCVATFKKRQERDWSSRPGFVSCRHFEQLVDEVNLSPNIRPAHPPRLSLPDHVHCFVALDGSPRRLKLAKPLLGFHASFDRSMILLHDVVHVLDRPVAATAS